MANNWTEIKVDSMTGRLKSLFAASSLIVALVLNLGASAKDTNLAANEVLAYQAIELWLSGSKVDPAEILAPGYVNHLDSEVGVPSESKSRNFDAFRQELKRFHAAFSDVKVTSKIQVAEGDMVATRVTISAVHTGTFVNEPPTGKPIHYDSVEFTRIKNGKIVETWVTWDKYAMFKQIGIIK